jgi:cytochrome o ubiquinol oxidase subunit 1
MGITRRLNHFSDPSLQIWFQIAAVGAVLILFGIIAFLIQLYVSIRDRESLRDTTGDPWDARTLEWSTASPAPPYNFAFTPIVHERDAWMDMKRRGHQRPVEGFKPIHMPKNTATGFVLSCFCLACGFGLIWHIWWLVIASFVATIGGAILHTFNYHRDYYIPAEEVARIEGERTRLLNPQGGVS